MQRALVIVAVAVLVSLVHAQIPPFTIYQCTNSTPLATTNFCSSVVTYPIQTSVNVNNVDTAAYTLYNSTFAAINSSLTNCPSALKTYICQNAFQKCSPVQLSGGVGQAVCDSVNTGCGVTSFPTNITGATSCIANTARSVGGVTTVCLANTVATGLGQTCRVATAVSDITYTGAQSTISCPATSGCNTTTCTRANNLGDACTSNAGCVTGFGLLSSPLVCISGQCQYSGKRAGYNCTVNAECASDMCDQSTLKCVEQAIDQNCTLSTQCQKNLYCETSTGKCAAIALADEACGQVLSSAYKTCTIGFTCVNATSGAVKGTCRPNADFGAACSNQTAVLAYNAPLCGPANLLVNGTAVCIDSVCRLVLGNQGDVCDGMRPCRQDLTCQFPSGQTVGTCQPAASVSCSTDGSAQGCNALQTCSCSSPGSLGTCALQTTGIYQCWAQRVAFGQCMVNNCGGLSDPLYPYDGYSCASKSCTQAQNDYYCCLSKFEPNFVTPNNAPAVLCAATTTSAPTTAGPGTTGAPGTTTTPSTTKASDAIQNVISFTVMLVAFIALAL